MFARKLGRFAGLVLVLAVVFGGVGVASHEHSDEARSAVQYSNLTIEWE